MKKAFVFLLCISLLLCVCSCDYETPSDVSLVSDVPSDDQSDVSIFTPSDDISDISNDSSNDGTSKVDEKHEYYGGRIEGYASNGLIMQYYYDPHSFDEDYYVGKDYRALGRVEWHVLTTQNPYYSLLDFPIYDYVISNDPKQYHLIAMKFDHTLWGVWVNGVKNTVRLTEIELEKKQVNFPDGRVAEFLVVPDAVTDLYKTGYGATADPVMGKYINNSLYTSENPFDTVYNKLAIDYNLPGLLTDEQKAEVKKIRDDYDKIAHYNGDESNAEERLQKMQLPAEYYVFEYLKGEGITLEQILEAVEYFFRDYELAYEMAKTNYEPASADPLFDQVDVYVSSPREIYSCLDINKHYAKIIYEGDADKIRSEVAPISSFNVDGVVYPVSWFRTHPELLDDFAKRGYLEPILEFYRMAFDADTYEELDSDATNYYYEYIKAYERYCGTK